MVFGCLRILPHFLPHRRFCSDYACRVSWLKGLQWQEQAAIKPYHLARSHRLAMHMLLACVLRRSIEEESEPTFGLQALSAQSDLGLSILCSATEASIASRITRIRCSVSAVAFASPAGSGFGSTRSPPLKSPTVRAVSGSDAAVFGSLQSELCPALVQVCASCVSPSRLELRGTSPLSVLRLPERRPRSSVESALFQ